MQKKLTREEIEADATRLADEANDPRFKPVLMALMEYQSSLPVDQFCLDCGESLEVTSCGAAWFVKCPCGKSTSDFRGL